MKQFYVVIHGKVCGRGTFEEVSRMVNPRSFDHTKKDSGHTIYYDRFENEVAAIHPL